MMKRLHDLLIVLFLTLMFFGMCCMDSDGIYFVYALIMTFGGLAGMLLTYLFVE